MTMLPKMLKEKAGYKTAMVGKWHMGARALGQMPRKRGFDKFFGVISGHADHNTQETEGTAVPDRTHWSTSLLTHAVLSTENGLPWDLWEDDAPAVGQTGKMHSCYLYANKVVQIIQEHDTAHPLFLYWAQQVPHAPYNPMPEFEDKLVAHEGRRIAQAMITCADKATENVTKALQAKLMWDNALMLFASDNGGTQLGNGNNYPFRGGKYSDFEGGVRTIAFLAGGALPTKAPKTMDMPLHLCDWYATFAAAAGVVDPTDEASALHEGVPTLDSINMWPLIAGQTTERLRESILLSESAIIVGDYKFIAHPKAVNADNDEGKTRHGGFAIEGFWVGKVWPDDCKTTCEGYKEDIACTGAGGGTCLFDLSQDPYEEHDLSFEMPEKAEEMKSKYFWARQKMFQWNGGGEFENWEDEPQECTNFAAAVDAHEGFVAPMCWHKASANATARARGKRDKGHAK
jgi:hypothetical protein